MSGLLTWDTDSHGTISSTAPAMASSKAVKYKQVLQNRKRVKIWEVNPRKFIITRPVPNKPRVSVRKKLWYHLLLLIPPYFSPFPTEPKNSFGPHKN